MRNKYGCEKIGAVGHCFGVCIYPRHPPQKHNQPMYQLEEYNKKSPPWSEGDGNLLATIGQIRRPPPETLPEQNRSRLRRAPVLRR